MGRGPLGSTLRAPLPGASGSAFLACSQLSARWGQSGLCRVHRAGGVRGRRGALRSRCARARPPRSRPPPSLCPQKRTTASPGTTSCTRATARAAPTCWWSTPRPAASAARRTCSWPRPSSSRCPPAAPSSRVVSRGPRLASGRTSRKHRSEVTWHPTHASRPQA